MGDLKKALKKFNNAEKSIIESILIQLKAGFFENFDIKKLQGSRDVFRVRKGKIRIIFIKNGEQINILAIERRSDNTYNF